MAEPDPERWGVARGVATAGGLYLVQGIVWGTGGLVLLPRLAAAGVSLEQQTGIFALSGVPWVLKLAWGTVLDLPWVRRVRPIVVAALATAAVGAAIGALGSVGDPAGEIGRIAWLWLALNVALSLQDVATDAFAIDRIPRRLRGAATAVMLAGHHVGAEVLAGAWVGAAVVAHGLVGLRDLSWICLGVAVVAGGAAMLDRGPHAQSTRAALGPAIAQLVRSGPGLRMLGFAGIALAADVATSATSAQWLIGLGWSPDEVAARIVWPLVIGSLAGHLLAALAVDRIGRARAIAWTSAGLGLSWIGFATAHGLWHDIGFIQGFVAIQAVVTAAMYVAIHAAMMDATLPALRATQFAALTAMLNLPRVWAPLVATAIVGRIGFAAMFAVCGAFQIAVALLGRWAVAEPPSR